MHKLFFTSNHSKGLTMYSIFMTLVSATFIYTGASHVQGGWLFIIFLVAGGVYLGHVVTEALNDTE